MIRFQLRRGLSSMWTEQNPILREGEPGIELDTNRYKLGDGVTRWADLPYFIDEPHIMNLIQAWVNNGGPDLFNHVNSPTPHPIYDDGPSLALLYENAKV